MRKATNLHDLHCANLLPGIIVNTSSGEEQGELVPAGVNCVPKTEGMAAHIPLAAIVQTSFTNTNSAQPGPAAPDFGRNDNFAVDQENYDGFGRNASGSNTLFLLAWMAF